MKGKINRVTQRLKDPRFVLGMEGAESSRPCLKLVLTKEPNDVGISTGNESWKSLRLVAGLLWDLHPRGRPPSGTLLSTRRVSREGSKRKRLLLVLIVSHTLRICPGTDVAILRVCNMREGIWRKQEQPKVGSGSV
jgi:hypothetical protein